MTILVKGYERVSECYIFKGQRTVKGYGVITASPGNIISAHRVSYETWFGPVPDGLVIDHTCHNEAAMRGLCAGGNACVHRACVNPLHLRAVTAAENGTASPYTAKGCPPSGAAARNKLVTHCPEGHEYTDENTYVRVRKNQNLGRECRTCMRARDARNRAKAKLKKV